MLEQVTIVTNVDHRRTVRAGEETDGHLINLGCVLIHWF